MVNESKCFRRFILLFGKVYVVVQQLIHLSFIAKPKLVEIGLGLFGNCYSVDGCLVFAG